MSPIPSQLPLPPLHEEGFDPLVPERTLAVIERGIAQHGDLFRLKVNGLAQPAWVANHPEHVKALLVTDSGQYTKGMGLERVRILLGNGIMVSEGPFWRGQRRMVQPSFAPKMVGRFRACTVEVVRALAERWQQLATRGEAVAVNEEMSASTLDIVLRALFGADLDELVRRSGTNPFALVTEHGERDLKFAVKFRALAQLIGSLIREKRARGDVPSDTLISDLMQATDEQGQPMPERALVDEIMTLIVAGHETTASSLAFAWHLLATHADAQERLAAEVADYDLETAASATGAYLDQVITETLRLYPPGWLLTRRAVTPGSLGGHELPAGADAFISVYSLHRHPDFWPAPLAFQPERFEEAASAGRHRYAYIPFAMGPRRCVGESLALMEMRVHLAMLASRFRLRAANDEPVELEAQVNLRTRKPLYMRLESRS